MQRRDPTRRGIERGIIVALGMAASGGLAVLVSLTLVAFGAVCLEAVDGPAAREDLRQPGRTSVSAFYE